ncbi:RDD family protein [Pseudonocardia lacus]|uniref:RDD family protein n=1 Tax=Pseudonocardia lacus TaxID=2835865 RepID=UPI001BDC2999|nr:RDD family protein [Pseudonocardia lacus]
MSSAESRRVDQSSDNPTSDGIGPSSVLGVTTGTERVGVRRRLLASVGDLGLIAGWLGALTAAGAVGRALAGRAAEVPPVPLPALDLAAAAVTVLPVGAYLAATEAGRHQATLGKRWQGLRVVTVEGAAIGWRRAVVRNVIKLLPWQLAHLAVSRWIVGVDPSPAILTAYGASVVLAVGSVAVALRDAEGRALHDLAAGTRVVVA